MRIFYSNQARHFLRQHREVAKSIMDRIEDIAKEPHRGAIRLKGENDIFRVRAGDIRILYEIDMNTKIIGIIRISRRENAYR
jgi:mRNA interferase RelE/StbE